MRGGATLALGLVGVLAAAGAVRARGSRVIGGSDPVLGADLTRRLDDLALAYRGREGWIPYRNAEESKRFAREHGLTYLGAGTSRSVFAVPARGFPMNSIALKIGRVADNRAEARVWREAPAWMKALLVPVLGVATDGDWLAMERVRPVTPEAYAKMRDDLDSRRSRRLLLDCGVMDLGLLNTASDGRILDYAYLGNENQWRSCTENGEAARVRAWTAGGSDPKLLRWVKNG